MTISDILQLVGIIVSLLTSAIAIAISICTLRQNSKMIENSFRPYIGIYGMSTYICEANYYIIIKNFGQSSAYIKSFSSNYDLMKLSKHDSYKPFGNLVGASIAPGQSYRCIFDFKKIKNAKVGNEKLSTIIFHIKYSSGICDYEEDIPLKLDGNLGNLESHKTGKYPQSIDVISETLQDIHIKSL